MSSALPTRDQTLLLRAALCDGEAALDAWTLWEQRVGVDDADWASHRLLPLVYVNLRHLAPADPALPRLKGLYRFFWYHNQLFFRRIGAVLACLREGGVETLALKGVALAVLHYGDLALRPMADADLLVRPEKAATAVAVLLDHGWTPTEPLPPHLEVKHAHPFAHRDGTALDLHWNLLWEAAPDGDLWTRSVPLEVAGEPTVALDPTDQLLHVCVHGAQWDPIPSMRWAADAVTVLRRSTINWPRLVDDARARRVTLGLHACLRFLQDDLDVSVPAGALAELASSPHPLYERIGHRAKAWPGGLIRRTALSWERHQRLAKHYPEYARVGLVESAKEFAGVEQARDLPSAAVRYVLAGRRGRRRGMPAPNRRRR